MPARPLLLALAAALALAGCRTGVDAPPDEAGASGAAADPFGPGAPGAGGSAAEHVFEAPVEPLPDTGVALHPPADSAPPASMTVRVAVGSCDVTAVEPVCFAFSGPGWTPAAAQAECANAGGVYGSAACPTNDRVGECVHRPDGDVAREVVHTFYRPMDTLLAEGICDGTFRPF
jgi:hypothetical protein